MCIVDSVSLPDVCRLQVTQETLLKLKGLENVKADIFTRALVGFIDAQAHNQVVAPCQNFGMCLPQVSSTAAAL
jgi:hypothetical protein